MMAANVLMIQGSRASAAMVLTWFFKNIPVSAPEELIADQGPFYQHEFP